MSSTHSRPEGPGGWSPRPWSLQEEIDLLTRLRDGASLEALATTHGRTKNAIAARLERLGQLLRDRSTYKRCVDGRWIVFATFADCVETTPKAAT